MLVLVGAQTSLWLQLFGHFPTPSLWLPTLVYWTIYRSPKEGLFMIYVISVILSPLTVLPLGVILLINTCLFFVGLIIKSRFYQPGPVYYSMLTGFIVFMFPAFHTIFSWTFFNNPLKETFFFLWILKPLLTMLFCFPLHLLYVFYDDLTEKSLPTETGRKLG